MINNSPKTRRALSIVAAKGDQCSPAVFATDMWPDSPGWQKPSKHVRNGVRSGAVMNTAAAAYLGRLRSAGLIEPSGAGYSLTTEGWNLLASGSRVATGGQQAIPPPPPAYVNVPWQQPYWDGRVYVLWDGARYLRWDGQRFVLFG
jgi:hypothetical protein